MSIALSASKKRAYLTVSIFFDFPVLPLEMHLHPVALKRYMFPINKMG
jgi:hypothetical protein